ncbi:hypothetical protein J6590_012023 [Homalodisca vitripennis]|nr:hypothetical protein J6590_012023 [Homalodisca vitripennis]
MPGTSYAGAARSWAECVSSVILGQRERESKISTFQNHTWTPISQKPCCPPKLGSTVDDNHAFGMDVISVQESSWYLEDPIPTSHDFPRACTLICKYDLCCSYDLCCKCELCCKSDNVPGIWL